MSAAEPVAPIEPAEPVERHPAPAEDAETIISVKGLVSRFGERVVHDGVDLEVKKGEIFGLVGGSGAGKTVLLNSLIGLRLPDGGEVQVLGQGQQAPVR